MAMTAKQRRFCDEYLTDMNATQAAIRAGYKRKNARSTGAENLTKPYIQEYVRKRMDEREAALVARGDEVLRYLTGVMRGDDEEQRVVVADGCPSVESYVDQRNRLKAAELLARCHGLMTQRVDLQGPVPITFVDDLEDDVPNDG